MILEYCTESLFLQCAFLVKKKKKGRNALWILLMTLLPFFSHGFIFLIALTYRFAPDTKLMDYVCGTEPESEVPRLRILWKKKRGTPAGSTASSDLASLTSFPKAHSLYWKEHNHVLIFPSSLWKLSMLVLCATWLCRTIYENSVHPCRGVNFFSWGRAVALTVRCGLHVQGRQSNRVRGRDGEVHKSRRSTQLSVRISNLVKSFFFFG